MNLKQGSMLDRKKVLIDQGLFRGKNEGQPISIEDLKQTSNNTSKTDKTAVTAPANITQPEARTFLKAKRNYKGGS